MKFRTEIFPEKSELKIKPEDKIVTFGSCFADNIAGKFIEYKFRTLKNPFGVLYNPVSIANSVKIIYDKILFSEKDLIFHQGEYHSFYHHSSFSSDNPANVINRINAGISSAHNFIKGANLIVLTFGTAWVYEYIETNEVVSNCHKIPANKFNRRKIDVRETTSAASRAIKLLKMINPELKILLTISPVRHWKDGAVENQRSKATLILAAEKLVEECDNVFYFPSYEIVIDDLRDYRFYSSDLVHPNNLAVEYIWEKFAEAYFPSETIAYLSEINKIKSAFNHKIRNRNTPETQLFIESTINKINAATNKYPHLNFAREMKRLLGEEN